MYLLPETTIQFSSDDTPNESFVTGGSILEDVATKNRIPQLRQKFSRASPAIQDDMNNALHSLSIDLDSKDSVFISELIQNADDNSSFKGVNSQCRQDTRASVRLVTLGRRYVGMCKPFFFFVFAISW